ncbi:MAG: MFS transporter [Lachnospiraceae bacterium]|nr:MFS transporter [Lachnospiraceae bacterium]
MEQKTRKNWLSDYLNSGRIYRADLIVILAFFILSVLLLWLFPRFRFPVERQETLKSACMVKEYGNRIYVLDSGHSRLLVMNEKGELEFSIRGNSREKDTFTYVDDFTVDEEGNIYIKEGQWDGMRVCREAILVYSAVGAYRETLRDDIYTDAIDKHRIYGISVSEGVLKYAISYDTNVEVVQKQLNGGEQSSEILEYQNAFHRIADIHIAGDEVYILDKNGIISYLKDKECSQVYEGDASEIPYQFCVTETGDIYYTDIRGNEVKRIKAGTHDASVELKQATYYVSVNENQQIWIANDDEVSRFEKGRILQTISHPLIQSGDRALAYMILLLWGLMALIGMIILLRLLFLLRKIHLSTIQMMSILIICSLVITSVVLVYNLLSKFEGIYRERIYNQIEMSAYAIANEMNAADIQEINQASDFGNVHYQNVIRTMENIIDDRLDSNRQIYCNILRYDGAGKAYAIAYLDQSIGTYYPLDDVETQEVIKVYQTHEKVWNDGKDDITGNYIYVKVPVLNGDGNVAAVVAVGTETVVVSDMISTMRHSIYTMLIIIVILLWLAVGEMNSFAFGYERYRYESKVRKTPFPGHVVRLQVFFVFTAYNMATTFLPVYIMRHTKNLPGVLQELGASIPITVNLFIIGVMSLFCSHLLRRFGFQKLIMCSILFTGMGSFCMAVFPTYIGIFAGQILDGIGEGIVMNAIYILLAALPDEADRAEGFATYNAASFSGINFGMMLGATLASWISQRNVFFVQLGIWIITAFICFVSYKQFAKMSQVLISDDRAPKGKTTVFLKDKQVISFMTLIQNPYILLNGFVFFYVPIFCDAHHLSETVVSIIYMIYAVLPSYFGNRITSFMLQRFHKNAMYFASLLNPIALLVFACSPNLYGLIVALLVLSFSNSFGKSIQQTYYTSLPATKQYGEDYGMGIYNFTENIGESVGPAIMGTLMSATHLIPAVGCFSGLLTILTGIHARIARKD